ncbi:hypothetical protein IWX48DRAFT_362734 [Phyllosticta citricarpa]
MIFFSFFFSFLFFFFFFLETLAGFPRERFETSWRALNRHEFIRSPNPCHVEECHATKKRPRWLNCPSARFHMYIRYSTH